MDWVRELDKWAADYLPDLKIAAEEPMARHTSFRVGGPARRMAFPERGEQLVLLWSFAWECGARPLLIGNGTNLLAPDDGLDRLVIATGGMRRVEAGAEPGTVLAESGAALAQAADQVKAFVSVELNMGQMIEDVRLATECRRPVSLCNRTGGMIPSPGQVLASIRDAQKGVN